MPKRVRVNVTTAVNADKIRREERNGRQVIVVPSKTMPDEIIMNGVKYPADEIKNSFSTLNRTPAPLGHPEKDGFFLSARDPEAINSYWVGAWNENVRQEKDENGRFRVHVDKVIDVEVAESSEKGKAVLDAIDNGKPIHTSTGLWANLKESGSEDFAWTAHDIEFDHDAILLNETGAATPAQGVGMMVHQDGKDVQVEVMNSMLDRAEEEMDWAMMSVVRALDTKDKASFAERLKSAIEGTIASMRETTANSKEAEEMAVTDKQFETLSASVDTLAENFKEMQSNALTADQLATALATAVEPLQNKLDADADAAEAAKQKELDGYVDIIVKANVMDEATAKQLPLAAAKTLAANHAKPGKADAAKRGFSANEGDDDEFASYDPNENLKEAS